MKKVMFYFILIVLTKGIQWYHLWCCWFHSILTPMVSPDEKSHAAPHLNHLNLWNSVLAFTMPLATCDADPNANGISCRNSLVAPHFNELGLRNSMAPFRIPSASHDADINANGITGWKKCCCTLFSSSWPKQFSGAIYCVIGVLWCQCK